MSLAGFSQMIEGDDGMYYDNNQELYSGKYSEYFDNGILKMDMWVKEGLKDGEERYFYLDGKPREIRSYKSGHMDGLWKTFNEEGIKTAEARYKNNQKHGKWYIWDDNGILRYDMSYIKGKKKGIWIMFDSEGKEEQRKDYSKN